MKKIYVIVMLIAVIMISGCSENPVKTLSYEEAERSFVSSAIPETMRMENLGNGYKSATLTVTLEQYLAGRLGIKEDKRICGNFWFNEGQLILSVPQFIEKYLTADLRGIKIPESLSEELVKELTDTVLNEYFSLVENAHTTKNAEFDDVIGDIIFIEITDEMMCKLALAGLDKLKNNDEFKSHIEKAIAKTEESLAAINVPQPVLSMTVYVKGSEIVKREIAHERFSLTITGNKISAEIYDIAKQRVGINLICEPGHVNGEVTVSGIKIAAVELVWSNDSATDPLPALNTDNSINAHDFSLEDLNEEIKILLEKYATFLPFNLFYS